MKLQWYLPLLSIMLGCNGDKETDSANTETAPAFTPTEGNWSFDNSAYSNDICNLGNIPLYSASSVDALIYSLTNASDTTMTLVSQAGVSIDCTRDGMQATCENITEMENPTYTDGDGNEVESTDTVVTLAAMFYSTFTDSESATYTAELDGSCVGEECDLVLESIGVGANPCTSELSGRFELQD